MGTPLHHFCNQEFIEEIEELVERNVLVFMLDGSVLFGRITRVCDCVVTIMPAIGINNYYGSAFPFIEFRPPNGTLAVPLAVSEVEVDACNIAAVIEGPFVLSPLAAVNGIMVRNAPLTATSYPERRLHSLVEELKEVEGQNIGVTTLGGWTFSGQLGDVDECIILIGSATVNFPPALILGTVVVFGPAFPGGAIVLTGNFHAWINSKSVVQVLLP